MQKGLMFFLFSGLFIAATYAEEPDTLITLQEVSITARRQTDFGTGHNTQTLDSLALQRQPDQDLGYLLGRQTGLFIKSYGPGILASTALRGGQPGQTALMWNGFNLHSPMNGQTDLALLPALFADEVQVQYGGGSALWGSGAMGGAIFINNHPSRKQGLSGSLGFYTGSIGDLSQQVKISYGRPRFSTTLRAFNRNAGNQYRFENTTLPENPIETQELAGITQRGIMHDTWFQLGKAHRFDLRWWWQESDRDIPPSLDMAYYESRQQDQSLRLNAQYQLSLPRLLIFVRGAHFEDYLDFSDNFEYLANSYSNQLTGEAEARWNPLKGLIVNWGFNVQKTTAKAEEYEEEKYRNSLALFASTKWEAFEDQLEVVLSGRQEIVRDREIPFSPSLGLAWKPIRHWVVKGNAGYSYLLPSLNDLYWNPGGNPDLKPEQGWGGEMRVERNVARAINKQSFNIFEHLSIGGYHRSIRNWIIWLPQGDSWIWMPENRLEVKSYGLESRWGGHWQLGQGTIEWSLRYDHTIAQNSKGVGEDDPSMGKQLIYVPHHRGGINLRFSIRSLGIFYNHEITGKRYTNSDNSQSLPSYHTGDIGLYWKHSVFNHQLGLNLTVENLWNTPYQIIANRPMPLRYFRGGITFSFAQKTES
ncbi:MAG: TonB-dependent receptor [Bacteroides sp.]|jgi:iron complex outermembrane receptor protein|nr:TonB-dependent receptor [Bacteroides sp.]